MLQLEEAANNLRRKQTHNQEGEEEQAHIPNLQVLLHSSRNFGPSSIRELTVTPFLSSSCCKQCTCPRSRRHDNEWHLPQSEHVSRLVRIPGIVTSASKPKASMPCPTTAPHSNELENISPRPPCSALESCHGEGWVTLHVLGRLQHKATHVTVICTSCKNTRVIPCKPGLGGAAIPRTCNATAENEMGDAQCGLDPFVILPHKSAFVDQQTLKLQASACVFTTGPQ